MDSDELALEDDEKHPVILATQRLAAAFDRLETNLQYVSVDHKRGTQDHKQMAFFARENESLRTERENLQTAIAQLQYQYNDLQQVATAIYGKLDDSIHRLTQIIEE